MINKKGFTIIEVLVATLIMATSISVFNMAYKQFVEYRFRLVKYQDLYSNTLNVISEIMSKDLKPGLSQTGSINGYDYTYRVSIDREGRNYTYNEFQDESMAIEGEFIVQLLKIRLDIGGRVYHLYKTQFIDTVDNDNFF